MTETHHWCAQHLVNTDVLRPDVEYTVRKIRSRSVGYCEFMTVKYVKTWPFGKTEGYRLERRGVRCNRIGKFEVTHAA